MGGIWLPENTYLMMFQMPFLGGICMELRHLANAEPRGDSCVSAGAPGAWITYSTWEGSRHLSSGFELRVNGALCPQSSVYFTAYRCPVPAEMPGPQLPQKKFTSGSHIPQHVCQTCVDVLDILGQPWIS